MNEIYIVVAVIFVFVFFSYLPQWYGIAFMISGHIIFYSILYFLNVETSAAIAGGFWVTTGANTLFRVSKRIKRKDISKIKIASLLFMVFVLIWYFRWIIEETYFYDHSEFMNKAYFFMFVFAIIPFFTGLFVNNYKDVVELINAVGFLGIIGAFLLLLFWFLGIENRLPDQGFRWNPLPYLNGITMSFDIGLGALAFFSISPERERSKWISISLKSIILIMVFALSIKIGERGPFLFLIIAIMIMFFVKKKRQNIVKKIGVSFIFIFIIMAIVLNLLPIGDEKKVVTIESYSSEQNKNRIALIYEGLKRIYEKPILGWGSSLAGRRVKNAGTWQYSHVWILDGLIETGVIGAFFQLTLFILCLKKFILLTKNKNLSKLRICLIPITTYVFFESQVSGHITTNSPLWLFMGIILSIYLSKELKKNVLEKEKIEEKYFKINPNYQDNVITVLNKRMK